MNTETLNLLEYLRSWDKSALIVPSEVSFLPHQIYDYLIADSSIVMLIRQLLTPSLILNIQERG